ncbi:Catechol 2,3-dioxygenase [Saccharopolyspora kobensis]|uniref:Catechol 2,3-dioxygenase n=1 Tax=Saccharopolyspora kobensis TaxID=146035 RepID=A0A1H6DRM2_9PSEU|nr:VOC family protein [Saccharopolyspora kobensis]SEG87951.1 Catechol 2,3-dioxygenase [Saccharopolyspora kobensis]SFE03993.1 Catechol 2,3-dioxygenase [Saccharopolyspora kobensis]
MGIELNHTIVGARDKHASARFLADVLGVEVGAETGPFVPVVLDNSATLDYMTQSDVRPQHYAFLVDEARFDEAFGRIRDAGIAYWADPGHQTPGEINHRWGGRGVYFDDPDGHNMELLTKAP